jgi:cation transporter-like permease
MASGTRPAPGGDGAGAATVGADAPRGEKPTAREIAGWGLAIGWLLVPMIQYIGTVQRTQLQLEGVASLPELASLDLLPFYVLLLALTVLFVVARLRIQRG